MWLLRNSFMWRCECDSRGVHYVSLGLVHHPRKSHSEKHPKRGWSLGQFWHPIPGNHWTTLIFRPLTGIFFFSHAILYTLFVYCYSFGHFDLKETKKWYPFYAFLFTRMMYRPQWDILYPPGCDCSIRWQFLCGWRHVERIIVMIKLFIEFTWYSIPPRKIIAKI